MRKARTYKWSRKKLIKDLLTTVQSPNISQIVSTCMGYSNLNEGDLGRLYTKKFPNCKFRYWSCKQGDPKVWFHFRVNK